MKKIIALLLAVVMCLGLVACGGGSSTNETKAPAAASSDEPTAITLKVWAPQVDQENDDSWLPTMLTKFEEAHPEYIITWDIGVCGEGDAAGIVKNDPAAAADIYFYANDQMGTLIEAGALAKIGGSYLENLQNNFAQSHIDLLTYTDGGVYGFPTAPNTWCLWYNNEVFTEEDVKSLDTMLEKGVVSFPMDNSWYTAAFFYGVGGTCFGPTGTDAEAGIDFSGDLCVAALNYMVDLVANPNFINDADGVGVEGMKKGTIAAMFTGEWDEPQLREALGDSLSCITLPTFTIDGTSYQMKSFASNKAVGVNPNASNPKAAMQLAEFLTSAEALQLRYEKSGYIPAAKDAVVESATANVVSAQMNYAVPQPVLAEMANYWDPVKTLGTNLLNGSVNHDNAADMLQKTLDLLNNGGL